MFHRITSILNLDYFHLVIDEINQYSVQPKKFVNFRCVISCSKCANFASIDSPFVILPDPSSIRSRKCLVKKLLIKGSSRSVRKNQFWTVFWEFHLQLRKKFFHTSGKILSPFQAVRRRKLRKNFPPYHPPNHLQNSNELLLDTNPRSKIIFKSRKTIQYNLSCFVVENFREIAFSGKKTGRNFQKNATLKGPSRNVHFWSGFTI